MGALHFVVRVDLGPHFPHLWNWLHQCSECFVQHLSLSVQPTLSCLDQTIEVLNETWVDGQRSYIGGSVYPSYMLFIYCNRRKKKIDARSHIGIDRHTQCVNGRGQIGMFFAPIPCYIILVCSKCSHVIICNNIAPQRI